MKLFTDLTTKQQAAATRLTLTRILWAITEGGLRFDDSANGDELQARIDRAREKVEREQTPHLWGEEILLLCREDLTKIAARAARDAVFTEGETTIDVTNL